MQAYFPIARQAEAVGKLRRAVQAQILMPARGKDVLKPCTVPAGTPVKQVDGLWYAADLAWLERSLERSKECPPGFARTTIVYHGANRYGIPVPESDVIID